ncbi:lipopolysaccharide assembly protein LapA domain-containing protein [Shimia sediminis]|uniref:lipopolysaccharide assembly protein LapA domain-containing protein n=1 Tax=Shimia sediminis TaxID=2497945 RepID=UPI000F8F4299|nr:LapA family protein [Shimia sediminis]
MRYIRYGFWAVVGIALISVAMANRGIVQLRLFPDAISDLLGLNHTIALPLFIVILMSIAVGLLIGFVWEWLREHKHRSEKNRTQRALKQTQREVRRLKGGTEAKKDDVLAILDEAS